MKGHKTSTSRRHVYFYVLLFLATVVGHNAWKLTAQSVTPPAVQQAQQIVATANQMNP